MAIRSSWRPSTPRSTYERLERRKMLQCRGRASQALAEEFVNLVRTASDGGELTDQGVQPDLVGLQPLDQAGVIQALRGTAQRRTPSRPRLVAEASQQAESHDRHRGRFREQARDPEQQPGRLVP